MNYIDLKNEIKNDLKDLAHMIKTLKFYRKPSRNFKHYDLDDLGWMILEKKRIYRHKHIAYCQYFNGTEYIDIEKKCFIEPDYNLIDEYINDWKKLLEVENV